MSMSHSSLTLLPFEPVASLENLIHSLGFDPTYQSVAYRVFLLGTTLLHTASPLGRPVEHLKVTVFKTEMCLLPPSPKLVIQARHQSHLTSRLLFHS